MLIVKGRSDLLLKLEIIKKVLIIVLIFITIRYGIIGLLWGQLAGSVIAFYINTYYTGKFLRYNSWEQTRDILPILFLAIIAGAIVWGIDYRLIDLHYKNIYRLLIGGTIGSIVYYALAAFFKLDSLRELKNIILKK